MSNYIDQFRAAMQQHGITPPTHIVADGKPHSFDGEGSGGKKKVRWLAKTGQFLACS